MELLEKAKFNFGFDISDFVIDPLNLTFITSGESLNFITNNKVVKSIKGKMKNSSIMRFIQYNTQLFSSNDFYIISNFVVYKIDGKKKKIVSEIGLKRRNILAINVSSSGKIIYITNNTLYLKDINSNVEKTRSLRELGVGVYKIYILGGNIVVKHRKEGENEITLLIMNLKTLKIISKIKSSVNHIYPKIVNEKYLASTLEGEIEVWDIVEAVVQTSHKISNSKITYFDEVDNKYYIGNSKGELIITNSKFKIIKKLKLFTSAIKKIIIINNNIYVLSQDNTIKVIEILKEKKYDELINEFISKYNIDVSYKEFFTKERVLKIKKFLDELTENDIDYTPNHKKIFRFLNYSLYNIKVCIMGKDPYFQKGVATGRAFEVEANSWQDEKINTSLKNILKLIYKTYTGRLADIVEIRNMIRRGDFKILAPNKLFEYWEKQGVLLLNSSLTTVVNKAGAHHKFWLPIIKDLLVYISNKNLEIVYLLWGNDAAILEKNILNGKIIKHNHPAICGNLNNKNDFLLGSSFEETKNLIDWIGEKKYE